MGERPKKTSRDGIYFLKEIRTLKTPSPAFDLFYGSSFGPVQPLPLQAVVLR
jgi:hypothetical protein